MQNWKELKELEQRIEELHTRVNKMIKILTEYLDIEDEFAMAKLRRKLEDV
jgi:hypothetical protein